MIPPIFCITLRQTPERSRLAQEHFLRHGLNVTIFHGIHAPSMGLETTKIADRRDGYVMSSGQVGCLLSHYMLWQTLYFLSYDEVLIVEDDAVFCEDFRERFAEAYRILPSAWQFCYVGHTTKGSDLTKVESTKYEPGTHAYLVKRETLDVLLRTNQEARTHCDIQIAQNSLPHLHSYRFMPSLVEQRTQRKNKRDDYEWLTTTNVLAHTDATKNGPLQIIDTRIEDLLWRIRSKLLPQLGGWCHEIKAVRMAELIIATRPKICVEIGVFQGKSLFTTAMTLRFVGEGKAWGIDSWRQADSLEDMPPGPNRDWWKNNIDHEHFYQTTEDYRKKFGLADWCELIRARSDDSAVLDRFVDESVNFFHLDGNHGPQSLTDAKLWAPKLAPGCILLHDDVNWNESGVLTNMPAYEHFLKNGFEVLEPMIGDCAILQKTS